MYTLNSRCNKPNQDPLLEPQPAIELFGLVLREPVTALTDVFIAVICIWAYIKLKALPKSGEVHTLFKYHFLFMGIGTFLGGIIGHALMNYLPEYMKLPGWILGVISVACLERAVIHYGRKYMSPKLGTFFLRLNLFTLVTFLILLLATVSFKIVLFHTVYGILLMVTGLTVFIYSKEKSKGSIQILSAIGVSIIGVLFFVLKIGIHKWFNHADVGHVFMMVATVLYYLGARDFIRSNN